RLDFVLIVLQPAIQPPPENIDGTELRFTPPFARDTGSRP
ncbi:MAG: hypothetical protein ACI867_001947, partial [Glaciecola sp.]